MRLYITNIYIYTHIVYIMGTWGHCFLMSKSRVKPSLDLVRQRNPKGLDFTRGLKCDATLSPHKSATQEIYEICEVYVLLKWRNW